VITQLQYNDAISAGRMHGREIKEQGKWWSFSRRRSRNGIAKYLSMTRTFEEGIPYLEETDCEGRSKASKAAERVRSQRIGGS
jgi:hypothetical protein